LTKRKTPLDVRSSLEILLSMTRFGWQLKTWDHWTKKRRRRSQANNVMWMLQAWRVLTKYWKNYKHP